MYSGCGIFTLSLWFYVRRITADNVNTLTEIGILYLRINDTKSAFDKLYEVTAHHENCSKAYLALGAILQVNLARPCFPSFICDYIPWKFSIELDFSCENG